MKVPRFSLSSITWLLVTALALLYIAWIGYVVWQDKCLDFYVYYLAAYGFSRGIDMYSAVGEKSVIWDELAQSLQIRNYTLPYRYPPLTAFLVWPLICLPPRWAAFIWLIGTALAFILAAWLIGKSSPHPMGIPLSLALLLFFVPPLTTLHAGQVNGFLLLTLAMALYAFARGQALWIGVGIAAGIMLKLAPVAHLGYLAWRRYWREAFISVVALIILLGVSLPLVDWKDLGSYVNHFVALSAVKQFGASGASQSIMSFVARLATHENTSWALLSDDQKAYRLGWGISLAVVLTTIILCWPRGKRESLFRLEFAFVTVAINLVFHHTWYHQFVLLLIPFFVLVEQALVKPAHRWMLIPVLIGYLAVDVHGLIWHHLEFDPFLVSMPFYAALLLWGFLAWQIARQKWAQDKTKDFSS